MIITIRFVTNLHLFPDRRVVLLDCDKGTINQKVGDYNQMPFPRTIFLKPFEDWNVYLRYIQFKHCLIEAGSQAKYQSELIKCCQ